MNAPELGYPMVKPRSDSIIHGLRVAKAHGTDPRFTVPRAKAARAAGLTRISWVACGCDICKAIQRWMKERQAAHAARRTP